MDKQAIVNALLAEREQLLKQVTSIDDVVIAFGYTVPGVGNKAADTGNHNGNGAARAAFGLVPEKYKDYPSLKNARAKVGAILKAEGKFLHMRQIQEIAISLEKKANPDALKGSIQQAVYALKNMENPPIVLFKAGDSNVNTFWGSKNWVNEKGEIKPEYMYDQNHIRTLTKERMEI